MHYAVGVTEPVGRLERRKQRTRQALITAAAELFERQGYDRTTVAEIAEAADVSTRTFFLHFRAKEDVLFGDSTERLELWSRTVAARAPGEPVADLLIRASSALIDHTWSTDLPAGRSALRARLVASSPALQAALVQKFLPAGSAMAEELAAACPELTLLEASAAVGAIVGAMLTSGLTALGREGSPAEVRDALHQAAVLAVRHTW